MVDPEINDVWRAALLRDAEELDAMKDHVALRQDTLRRKEAALAVAKGIVESNPGRAVSAAETGAMTESDRIPLGALDTHDASGRSHGFALVWVSYHTTYKLAKPTSRVFPQVEFEHVPTNVVNGFGVLLYAGREDGTNLLPIETTKWSLSGVYDNDTSEIDQIDVLASRLAMVSAALGPQQAA